MLTLAGTNRGVKLKSAGGSKMRLCGDKQETRFVLFACLAKRKSREVMHTQCVDAAIPLWLPGKPRYHSRSKEKEKVGCFCNTSASCKKPKTDMTPCLVIDDLFFSFLHILKTVDEKKKRFALKTNQTNNNNPPKKSPLHQIRMSDAKCHH